MKATITIKARKIEGLQFTPEDLAEAVADAIAGVIDEGSCFEAFDEDGESIYYEVTSAEVVER